jgi:hypothetical protein
VKAVSELVQEPGAAPGVRRALWELDVNVRATALRAAADPQDSETLSVLRQALGDSRIIPTHTMRCAALSTTKAASPLRLRLAIGLCNFTPNNLQSYRLRKISGHTYERCKRLSPGLAAASHPLTLILRKSQESAILSSCHPICNTALALYAPWCSCTRSIFAASSTPGG